MSIKSDAQTIQTQTGGIEKSLTDIKSALTAKKVTVPAETKLSGVPALIAKVETGAKVALVITAPDYEGETLTATKDSKKLTGKVSSGICRIEVDEEGTWTVSATDGNKITILTDMTFEGTLSKTRTYGVKITTAEPHVTSRVVYTSDATGMTPITMSSDGSADLKTWKNSWIFKKIYPVMLSRDGSVAYKLNPDNQNQKADGSASNVADITFNGNAMVCIEKFYTKFSMSGEDRILEISDTKQSGFEAIGFLRPDGSEADCVYAPMFMGSVYNSNQLRSIGNQTISSYSKSWTDCSTYAHNYGSGYEIEYWALNQILEVLHIILTKSTNSWYIGAGRNYNDGDSKTGLMMDKGPIFCDPTTKAVKFLWIEDFISNKSSGMYRWEAGALSQSSKLYLKMRGPYSGTSTSGYVQVSDFVSGSNYISKMKCANAYGQYPIAYSGSDSTYDTSYWYTNTGSSCCVSFRGNNYGLAGRRINNDATSASGPLGAALSFVPPA